MNRKHIMLVYLSQNTMSILDALYTVQGRIQELFKGRGIQVFFIITIIKQTISLKKQQTFSFINFNFFIGKIKKM